MLTSTMRLRSAVVVTVLTVAALVGCQPVDEVGTGARGRTTVSPSSTPQLGAPVRGAPESLSELVTRTGQAALLWQDEPRVSEISVTVTGGRNWSSAAVTYLAPDADRLFTVTVDSAGATSVERTTLATLDLQPVPEAALAELPELPADTKPPGELAAAARPLLDECGIREPVDMVLFASGAPFAWDGDAWTAPLAWRALALTVGGAGLALDPVTAAPLSTECTTPGPARGATVPPEGD